MKNVKEKISIAEQVFTWIDNNPFVRIGLKKDVLNLSSIARIIQDELKIKNFDAIMVAIRRYSKNIEFVENKNKKIKKLFQESTMEIKTGLNVYIVKNGNISSKIFDDDYSHIIKGNKFITIITDKDINLNYYKKSENLVEIKIKSPEYIEEVPGVQLELSQKLFEFGINVIENYSSYTDTIFLIKKDDLEMTLRALKQLNIK